MAIGSIVRGTLGVANAEATTRIRNVIKGAAQEEPANTPLFAMTEELARRGRKIALTNRGWKPEWFAIGRYSRTVTVSTTAPTTGTSIVVTDSSQNQVSDILEYSRENMLVVANDTTTNTLTVVRNTPARTGGGVVSIPASAVIRLVSSAAEQGAPKGVRFAIQPVGNSNRTQIFREGTGITRTQMQSAQYHTIDEFEDQIRQTVWRVREKFERAALMQWNFSEINPGSTGSTNHPRCIMGGLPAYIQTNYINAGGTLTDFELNIFINRGIRYGGNKDRILMGGSTPHAVIAEFPKPAIRTTVQSKFWGQEITRLGGSMGWRGMMIPNYQLDGEFWGGVLYALDMAYVGRYDLQGLDIDRDTADPGTDAMEAEVLMESSLLVTLDKPNELIYGIDY